MSIFTAVWLKHGESAEQKALSLVNECQYDFMIPFHESKAYQEKWQNKNTNNQKKLVEIAKNAVSVKVRCAAIKNLETMPEQVLVFADSAETIAEKCAAISKISTDNISFLESYANTENMQIRSAANKRLLEIASLSTVTDSQMIIDHLEFRPRYFANKKFYITGIKRVRELDQKTFKIWEQSYLDKNSGKNLLHHLVDLNNEAIKAEPPCGTMMQRHSEPYDVIIRNFDDIFAEIIYEIEQYSTLGNVAHETTALLLIIVDMALYNAKKERKPVFEILCSHIKDEYEFDEYDFELVDSRMDFYGEFIRGRIVRGVWWIGKDNIFTNPVICAIGAFGDVVWDSAMIENYEHASILIRDINDNIAFTGIILEKVYPLIKILINIAYTM